MMGTQKEIQDLDFLCNVIDAFLGDSDSSGLGENQPRLPSPFLFLFLAETASTRRDYWTVEGLLRCGVNTIMKCTGERITPSQLSHWSNPRSRHLHNTPPTRAAAPIWIQQAAGAACSH